MAIAAVPRYLGDDYSTAAPGHRFGMYLKLWGVDHTSGSFTWETRDYREEVRNNQTRRMPYETKGTALKDALRLTNADKLSMKALADRQTALANALAASGQLLRLEAKSVAPFSTGLGNEHPLENGFAFLNPYGLPYLPGSGVKGVLRQAARELRDGFNGVKQQDGWTNDVITALFGREGDEGDTGTDHQRGALSFWDVIPQLAGDSLKVEVMTPHQSHYYQNGATPHESGSPNPINFLAVPPDSGFAFHVQCNRPFLRRLAPELVERNRWQTLIRSALEHAFEWLGFGAKTAVGYGAMQIDKAAERAREDLRVKNENEARRQVEAAAREAQLAALSPVDRKIEEALAARQPGQSDDSAIFNALKADTFSTDELREAATKLRALMVTAKSWKETTAAKKPEKDKEHQRTLEVMKWLKG